MKVPDEYHEESRALTHVDVGRAGSGSVEASFRERNAAFRAFRARWAPRIAGTEELAWLDFYCTKELPRIERMVELLWVAALHATLVSRLRHLREEIARRADEVWMSRHIKGLSELNAHLHGIDQPEMADDGEDAAADPEAEAAAARATAAAHQALDALAVVWPERVDAVLRARWAGLDPETAEAWIKDLRAQAQALKQGQPASS